jgi:hypothetical protein
MIINFFLPELVALVYFMEKMQDKSGDGSTDVARIPKHYEGESTPVEHISKLGFSSPA